MKSIRLPIAWRTGGDLDEIAFSSVQVQSNTVVIDVIG